MRWVLLVVLLASITIHVTPTAGASECMPVSDASARSVDLGPEGTYYAKRYAIGMANYVEVWAETNGVPGLQLDASWNCGSAGDALVQNECAGKGCPGVII
jgi:hypothetical protein